jgi:hypothetical protein
MVPKKMRQEVRVRVENVPPGSRFKGYQDYAIQELEITPKDVIYRLEVWQAPDGTIVRAMLPQEVQGSHFGHQLRALLHNLYALGMTEPGLFDLLRGSGIEISEGQVHNILMSESEKYQRASEAILTAGIKEAPYIRADDTGAKHQHRSGYCTHIGGEYFAYYKTTSSKLRVTSYEAEKELGRVREAIWILYEKVKEASFTQKGKEEVNRLYDELIAIQSISPGVNEVIASFAQYKEEMLKALDYPCLPLHNNDSERDIRGVAKRRNISGSTKSEEGKAFRDGLMTLKQTCARLGMSFMGYLTGWFAGERVDLAEIVRERYRTSTATGPSG